jgi:hypothetical protein
MNVVGLAVELQQLEAHLLGNAQADPSIRSRCSAVSTARLYLMTKTKWTTSLETLCLPRLSGCCAIADQLW